MSQRLAVIVLAAGQGTRMRSALPKVLHAVCGVPMAAHVIAAARSLDPDRILVVVGHGAEQVRAALAAPDITFVDQPEQRGTADAVARCREAAAGCARVMVLNGDCPLVDADLLHALAETDAGAAVTLVSARVDEPGRLGRVVRDGNGIAMAVVEAADWEGPDGPAEINAGQYVFDAAWLWRQLPQLPRSASGELYLTHLVGAAHSAGLAPRTVSAPAALVLGVDDRVKLAEAETLLRRRLLETHMRAGVTIVDPATTYIDASVRIDADVTIYPGCWLAGDTAVAGGAVIGPNTTLRNSRVGAATRVEASTIEDSTVGDRVHLGPYAHVRGHSTIGDDCHLGNYAEVNRSRLGRGVKMHHFSYLGDAEVGDGANIAAGVITCNYDGTHKHRTVIGAGAFVGCDTMLVAPIRVGERAITGAGTVATRDIPAGAKAVGVPARILGEAHRD